MLRAAPHAAHLGTTIRDGVLRARGTTADPDGTVTLQLVFGTGDQTRTYAVRTTIQGGVFGFDATLPTDVRALLAARQGPVESYITYTSDRTGRIRGQLQAFSVLQVSA